MSVARDSAGGRLHPPLLVVLPWSLAVVLVMSLLFVLMNLEVLDTSDSLDLWLIRWTRAAGNPERLVGPPLLQESLRDFTALGGYAVLILVSVLFAGFAWVELSRGVCWFFSGTVWGGYFLAVAVKLLVQRERPDVVPYLSLARGSTSFPSAHAMMSVIVYGSIGLLLSARVRDRHLQRLFTVSPLLLSVLVGISRVFMGVHYPTDVLAGWALGLLWTWAAFRLRERWGAGRVEGVNR
ncbi:MAG TPA: phosphoesterase [Planctomycetaceae bacterium]|jgi:undecaprenyl-diphosphatase|nr:phosphoesterase [Planctomycetaceae bacterium]